MFIPYGCQSPFSVIRSRLDVEAMRDHAAAVSKLGIKVRRKVVQMLEVNFTRLVS